MPTAMTFTSLQEDLRRYIERGEVNDPTVYDQLPRLINNAEREIAQDLKILGFKNVVTADLIAGQSVYDKPDRWRSTVGMWYGAGADQERTPLFTRAYDYCRTYWPVPSERSAPEFYCDYDYYHWLIVPTPVATVPWEVIYYQQPALLDNANQTNWLTNLAPTTLLYRALLECEPFLKNDDRIPTWKAFYSESKARLDAQDIQRIVDNSTSRQKD